MGSECNVFPMKHIAVRNPNPQVYGECNFEEEEHEEKRRVGSVPYGSRIPLRTQESDGLRITGF